jgi:hypothetical protein
LGIWTASACLELDSVQVEIAALCSGLLRPLAAAAGTTADFPGKISGSAARRPLRSRLLYRPGLKRVRQPHKTQPRRDIRPSILDGERTPESFDETSLGLESRRRHQKFGLHFDAAGASHALSWFFVSCERSAAAGAGEAALSSLLPPLSYLGRPSVLGCVLSTSHPQWPTVLQIPRPAVEQPVLPRQQRHAVQRRRRAGVLHREIPRYRNQPVLRLKYAVTLFLLSMTQCVLKLRLRLWLQSYSVMDT